MVVWCCNAEGGGEVWVGAVKGSMETRAGCGVCGMWWGWLKGFGMAWMGWFEGRGEESG
jgi:hypothetical protein